MPRLMLSDEHWSKLRTIMRQHGIYHKPGLRKMVDGMLHRMRAGCPWRDLPPYFGSWNSIFQKFNRWSARKKLMQIFKSLVQDPDLKWEFLDGSYVRAHQHPILLKNFRSQITRLLTRDMTAKNSGSRSVKNLLFRLSQEKKSNSTIGNADMDWAFISISAFGREYFRASEAFPWACDAL